MMTSTLEKYLALLPIDVVVGRILPYTYRPQNPELMTDVRHFYESRIAINESVKLWWSLIDLHGVEHNPDYDFQRYSIGMFYYIDGPYNIAREIMDMIFDFLAGSGMIKLEYHHYRSFRGPRYHHRLFRGWRMTDKEWKDALETNNNEVQLNICWGLLTVTERNDIIALNENRIKER